MVAGVVLEWLVLLCQDAHLTLKTTEFVQWSSPHSAKGINVMSKSYNTLQYVKLVSAALFIALEKNNLKPRL